MTVLSGCAMLSPCLHTSESHVWAFVLLSSTLVRAGLSLIVLILVFVLFLVGGSCVFTPQTSILTNSTESRYFSIAGGHILSLMNEPEMKGEQLSTAAGDICFEHVSFAYQVSISKTDSK